MRKTGRPRGSGYDDAAAIAKVLDLMREEGATRRSAIIRVCGPDQLRRLEMKMAARGIARNGRSKKMTSNSAWDYGHRIGVDEHGTTVVLAPRELAGSILTLGEAGVDRTPFLLGLAQSMIAAGSGLIYIDGTGAPSLPARITEIASMLGREDDVQIVDFNAPHSRNRSFDPFAKGTTDVLVHTCLGLLDDAGPDGALWKGRAVAMFRSVMPALVWLRDEAGLNLNAAAVRRHLDLDQLIGLAFDERLPTHLRDAIFRYLEAIPGFDRSKGTRQAQQTREQHAYLEMQFSSKLDSLTNLNGEIFMIGSQFLELDEVALRRRILLVSLPASDRLDDRARNVADLVGASLMAMVRDLSDRSLAVSGDEVASMEKPNTPVFPIVLDRVGDFMVGGLEVLAGQARSLGFCLVFADRDLDRVVGYRRGIADAVVASCRTRIGIGNDGDIDLNQGGRYRRLRPMQAYA
ncbi:hypothetical protein [Methylobacterium radiotolerans]|uniref:hypothetical protein n=1 Tax=Methylobacterium radiotolerans TaxID=31998 RepID=UPI0038CF765B